MSDGTGRIYQRGETWWIDFSVDGERYRESSGSTKKKDARALLRKRMEEINRGTFNPDADEVTLNDLHDLVETDYEVNGKKSTDRLRVAYDHLREHFGGGFRVVNLTTAAVKRYARERTQDAAPGTVNIELSALRRGLTLAEEDGLLATTPRVPRLQVDNVRENFLTMADVAAICEEIGDDLAPVVRFAALTGWRKNEILGLRWRQVDFDAETVRLEPGTTKNREGRVVPFGTYPQLRRLLRQQRSWTDAVEARREEIVPFVFHRSGDRIRDIRKAWNGATERAGLDEAWFHDLRRTAVRNLEAAGVSRSVAMSITGHKTESVYRRYAISDKSAQEDGLAKLSEHLGGESVERKTVDLDREREKRG